jgi:hypothetical protein
VHGQPGPGLGLAFFLGELLGFFGFADLGGDDVEDPPALDPQRFGVEVLGLVEEVLAGLGLDLRVEVVRQRDDGVGDRLGLLDQHVTRRERFGDGLEVLVFEGSGELHLPCRVALGHPGLVGPPHRRRGGT